MENMVTNKKRTHFVGAKGYVYVNHVTPLSRVFGQMKVWRLSSICTVELAFHNSAFLHRKLNLE